MEKREKKGIFLLLTFVFFFILTYSFIGVVSGQANDQAVDKAYECLKNEINNKTSLTFEQAIFAALALGSNDKTNPVINNNKDTAAECWPKGKCSLKETAQIALVKNRGGESADSMANWLLSKNSTPKELNWYIEIDIKDHSAAQCSIKYGSKGGSVKILDDMSLTDNTASECLSVSGSKYWLRILSSCFDNQFEIFCNKDFVSTLIYQKGGSETVFVSPELHTSIANGSTKEQIKARCFKTGDDCDYEGSLWAALALNVLGKDVSAFVPYLSALAEDNVKFFPSAFLYSLVGSSESNEFFSDITQKQKNNNLWGIIGSPYKKYYDTSLALFALAGKTEAEKAKSSLIELQNKNTGCWIERDPIVDTAFLLYSGWKRSIISPGTGRTRSSCDSVSGQSCEKREGCLDIGGEVRVEFTCSGTNICCSKQVPKKTCEFQNGKICKVNEECDGQNIESSDDNCCIGECKEKAAPREDTCKLISGICKASCDSQAEQEESSRNCISATDKCCTKKETGGSGANWALIIILIILIILVILGIIYRDKLRVLWFRFRGKASVSPIVKPGVPPFSGGAARGVIEPGFRPSPRFAPTGQRMAPMRRMPSPGTRAPSAKDKEFEDTLKKLKEMSK